MFRLLPLSLIALLPASAAAAIGDYGKVPEFTLTERSGRVVTRDDLHGKVWVASFLFTRCTGPCPQVSLTLKRLQDELARYPDVRLVTFTVDPERDDPEELKRYADAFGADPDRWLFLTGPEKKVYSLLHDGFHVHVAKNTDNPRPGQEVIHDTRLFVVDREGTIRGSYEGLRDPRWPEPEAEYERNVKELRHQVAALEYEAWYLPTDFPRFNARLNACSTVLLLLGYVAIRRRLIRFHVTCMVSAFVVSSVFLASYLFFHLVIKQGQATSFASQTSAAQPPAWVGQLYLAILLTHTVLAALAAPLAVWTMYLGLRRRWRAHARVAKWTFPIWLYVSVTGVVVYWMLYRLYPAPLNGIQ
jgi:protein SCO1/2/putative membrane protein